MIGIGQRPDLQAGEILRRLHRLLRQHAARAEIIGPGDDADVGALEQRLLDRLGRAGIEGLGLLLIAGEEIAEVEGADERHEIGRDRRARHHQVDDAELDRVDDVDLLAELVVGEEGDLDLLAEAVGLQALDEVVVVDAAVGEFGIVRQRRGAFQLQGRGLGAADDRRRESEPCGNRRRRLHERATADGRNLHHASSPVISLFHRDLCRGSFAATVGPKTPRGQGWVPFPIWYRSMLRAHRSPGRCFFKRSHSRGSACPSFAGLHAPRT